MFSRLRVKVVLLALLLRAPVLPAQQVGEPDRLVDQGIQAYLQGEYQESCSLLRRALAAQPTEEKLVGALQYLAFSQLALGRVEQAESTFRRLLRLQPDFQLPVVTPPKIARVFTRVKRDWEATHAPVTWQHQPPARVFLGASLVLNVGCSGAPAGAHLLVHWQDGERGIWNQQQLRRDATGTWSVALPSPAGNRALVRRYYLELVSATGQVLARLPAAAGMPFRVSFQPAEPVVLEKESSTPWWVWALLGAVVAGAGTGLAIGLTAGGPSGGTALVRIQVVE
ncbi:MAG: hypothetical protein DRI34_00335 [Deltaproteobacteria bacterium]|nr:MAG: hypothetical protein DRI34_00335 [Deltaproteobacteria bacterium]